MLPFLFNSSNTVLNKKKETNHLTTKTLNLNISQALKRLEKSELIFDFSSFIIKSI